MKRTFLSPVVGLLALSSLNAQAPYTAQDKLFYEGKELFSEQNYVGATEKMTRYKEQGTNADLIQEADYYLAAAAFEKKEHNATQLLESYVENYPSGRHRLSVKFLLASSRFFDKEYTEAVEMFKQIDPDLLPAHQQEEYYLRLAISLLKINRLKEAEQMFTAVSQVSTRYRQTAQYYLGYIAYTEGDYKRALPIFEQVKNLPEFKHTAPYYIAQIKYAQRDYQAVINAGTPLLDQNGPSGVEKENRAELMRIVGESYFYTGNTSKALSLLTDYVDREAHPVRDGRYVLGVLLFEKKEGKKALEQFSEVTGPNDDMSQSAYLYQGQIYLQQGDKKSARLAFESAMKSGSDKEIRETAMYNYAMLLHDTSYSVFDESVTIYENFINEFPRSRYADKINDCLVEVYMTTKNYTAALTSIQKIKQPTTKVLTAKQRILFQLGTQAVANSDFKGAINYFNEVIALGDLDRETRAEALFWRGESLYRSALYNQAAKDFQSFLSMTTQRSKPIYALGKYNLAYCYFKLQEFAAAKRWFSDFIATDNGRSTDIYADALNRLGDCSFDAREFAEAESYYNKAAEAQPSAADYALFQKGFVMGLKKDYQGKISAMDRLIREMPSSSYIDDALFEKGRTYMLLEQNQAAEQTYKQLLAQYPQGEPARKASVQLGLLYFNTNQPEKAINAYKHVISNYPGSEEAATAAQDLKSVYMEMNDIQSYAQYIRSVNTGVKFDATEQDSLTFLAAERTFLKGDTRASERSLQNYLQEFPDGAFMASANYYLGSIYFNEKDYSRASQAFDRVLTRPQSKYAEDALARNSEIAYLAHDNERALALFKQLESMASKPENQRASKLGVLRCAYALNKNNEAMLASASLLAMPNLSPEIRQEALFVHAKMLIDAGQAAKANEELTELSKDTRTAFGAEGTYLLARNYFEAGQDKKAESVILSFMEKGTPHQYWMARSFLLLADVYIKTGKPLDAKQYLLSLQSNYKADDEIANEIEKRLKKIQQTN